MIVFVSILGLMANGLNSLRFIPIERGVRIEVRQGFYCEERSFLELSLDTTEHVRLKNCKGIDFSTKGSAEFENCTIGKVTAVGNVFFRNCPLIGGVITTGDACFVSTPTISMATARKIYLKPIIGKPLCLEVVTSEPVMVFGDLAQTKITGTEKIERGSMLEIVEVDEDDPSDEPISPSDLDRDQSWQVSEQPKSDSQ